MQLASRTPPVKNTQRDAALSHLGPWGSFLHRSPVSSSTWHIICPLISSLRQSKITLITAHFAMLLFSLFLVHCWEGIYIKRACNSYTDYLENSFWLYFWCCWPLCTPTFAALHWLRSRASRMKWQKGMLEKGVCRWISGHKIWRTDLKSRRIYFQKNRPAEVGMCWELTFT